MCCILRVLGVVVRIMSSIIVFPTVNNALLGSIERAMLGFQPMMLSMPIPGRKRMCFVSIVISKNPTPISNQEAMNVTTVG